MEGGGEVNKVCLRGFEGGRRSAQKTPPGAGRKFHTTQPYGEMMGSMMFEYIVPIWHLLKVGGLVTALK
jgi:hypothetical protein